MIECESAMIDFRVAVFHTLIPLSMFLNFMREGESEARLSYVYRNGITTISLCQFYDSDYLMTPDEWSN